MLRLHYLALVFLVCIVAGCDSQGANEDDQEWMTPEEALPEIQAIIDVFLEEADARGRTAALYRPSELEIVVDESVERDGEELCGFGGADPDTDRPTIYLAISEDCWDRPAYDREIIVLHELGHALLGRGHRDDMLPNGLRASIMYGGNIFGLYSETRSEHRAYYVDELFDPNTPVPSWGQ